MLCWQSKEASSVELVGCLVELVGSLWAAGHAAAIATLRTNARFWQVLPTPLSDKPGEVKHHSCSVCHGLKAFIEI